MVVIRNAFGWKKWNVGTLLSRISAFVEATDGAVESAALIPMGKDTTRWGTI